MIVMTTLFMPPGPLGQARFEEFKFCIQKNLDNPVVKELVVWLEGEWSDLSLLKFLQHPKVKAVMTDRRPTYENFFNLASFLKYDNQPVAICNTDVFFDETLALCEAIPAKTMYAITRLNWTRRDKFCEYALQSEGRQGSADAWVFRVPIAIPDSNILLGVIGCDSYIAQRALQASIRVANPCLSVHVFHLHNVGVRNDTPNGLNYWYASDYKGVCVQPTRL